MFGNILGDASEMEKKMKDQLSAIKISSEKGGIFVDATADGKFVNISIEESLLSTENKEQLEDLLLDVLNRVNEQIASAAADQSADFLKNMLPGIGDMFK